MAFSDKLFQASFKGISFIEIEDETEKGGIKNAVHEYPFSNRRSVENLGINLPIFNIKCQFHGENWQQKRDSFRTALTDGKSGILVSQFKGKFQAKATDYEIIEDTRALGKVIFKVTFVTESQAGVIEPSASGDTVLGVESASEDVKISAEETFADSLLDPINSAGVDTLIDQLNGLSDEIFQIARRFTDDIQLLQDMSNAIQKFDDSLSSLIKVPLSLASEITGLISQLDNLVEDNGNKLAQLNNLITYGDLELDLQDISGGIFQASLTSPKVEKNNDTAINILVRSYAVSLSYNALATVPFSNTEEADLATQSLDASLLSLEDSIGIKIEIPTTGEISNPGFRPETYNTLVNQRNSAISILDDVSSDLLEVIEVSTGAIGIRKLVYLYTGGDATVADVIKLNSLSTPIVEGTVKLLVRPGNANIA
jgi:hypothetical protein